ncbi:MAG: Omp85 family outer membrane protein [Chloroflexota bacterium]|nr:BamA/TamA family outer membrane protein [Lentimicrobium sp.]
MTKKLPILIVLYFCLIGTLMAQETDTLKSENSKKTFSFVPFPAVSFDSDLGFQYGVIGSFNYYGDRSVFPDYKWSLYAEWSKYTKGSGTNQLFFDSKYLLPYGIRVTADLSLLTEQALNFYGFNGYEAAYIPDFEDDADTSNSDGNSLDYISRMYYRHDRQLLRMTFDFQGNLSGKKLKWLAGFGRYNYEIGSVNISKLNKGLDDDKKLPDVPSLYDKYVAYGFIPEKEADGGALNTLKLGVVYDTRDNEQNTHKGLWLAAIAMTAPRFMGNSESAFTKLSLTWRHYIPLVPKKLTFAYRVGWQGTIDGKAPFYMQPFMIESYTKSTKNDVLGGGKSLRGVLRNRAVGDAFAYTNLELRYELMHFAISNLDLYLTLSGFTDMGLVTKPIEISKDLPEGVDRSQFFDEENDNLHKAYGAGLHIDLEHNLMIAVDYGMAGDKRDGKSGLYISIGFLF